MASLVDAFNDSTSEEYAFFKYAVLAIPIFFSVNSYLSGNFVLFWLLTIPALLLFMALLSVGINNVRHNKKEILTFNIIKLLYVLFNCLIALAPTYLILYVSGFCITTFVNLPFDVPYLPVVFKCIVWLVLGSIALTVFLSFSLSMNIKSAYNFPVIFESCVDILISTLFLAPQLLIMNGIIVGAVWYLLFYFKISLTNPLFIYYCSFIFVLNISVLSGYFAQAAYEFIKGDDYEYRDNYYIKGSGLNITNKKR